MRRTARPGDIPDADHVDDPVLLELPEPREVLFGIGVVFNFRTQFGIQLCGIGADFTAGK